MQISGGLMTSVSLSLFLSPITPSRGWGGCVCALTMANWLSALTDAGPRSCDGISCLRFLLVLGIFPNSTAEFRVGVGGGWHLVYVLAGVERYDDTQSRGLAAARRFREAKIGRRRPLRRLVV